MYRLENLQAEISLAEPDTTDMSVWMYSRSADHTSTNEISGSLVMNGKELASDVFRLGYCAMANGNIVLGISRSDKVKDYVEERGGSFFRQFILVSDGVITSQVPASRQGGAPCPGKNFRRPPILYRTPSSRNPLGFRRSLANTVSPMLSTSPVEVPQFLSHPDGKPHNIGDDMQHPHKKYQKMVPWIIFKAQ